MSFAKYQWMLFSLQKCFVEWDSNAILLVLHSKNVWKRLRSESVGVIFHDAPHSIRGKKNMGCHFNMTFYAMIWNWYLILDFFLIFYLFRLAFVEFQKFTFARYVGNSLLLAITSQCIPQYFYLAGMWRWCVQVSGLLPARSLDRMA